MPPVKIVAAKLAKELWDNEQNEKGGGAESQGTKWLEIRYSLKGLFPGLEPD